MDLLPKNHDQFRQTDYWDSFFKKRGRKAFEWYGEYAELCGVLHKYIKIKDQVLVVGCGNSTLSADLFDVGYKDLVSIDLSSVVIKQMKQQHERTRPGLVFQEMDVTQMDEFDDGKFSCVLDKGTLDAMFTSDSEEVKEKVDEMFTEITRVLRFGGRYICISLLQPHILDYIVAWFNSNGWPVRILRCKEAEENKSPEQRIFPVFAVIATKFKKMPNMPTVLEMSLSAAGQTNRLKSIQDLINSVRGIQQFAAVRASGAGKGRNLFDGDARQEDVALELRSPDSDHPKYSLFIVDRDKNSSLKYGVFIVPQGRDPEWLFSTKEGRCALADSVGCQRMVVVHLQRSHTFQDLKSIQNELSGFVMELSPDNLPSNTQVPFLSLGDDTVGDRLERCRGNSEFSGEFVVEDVQVSGDIFRRLVFLNNTNITQSEAKLKFEKNKSNKKKRKVVDHDYLACEHHAFMIASIGTCLEEAEANSSSSNNPAAVIRCLLIGLGGGALAMHIVEHFAMVHLDVIEIDPAIVRVAKEQFDFQESERLKLHVADGLDYIKGYNNNGGLEKGNNEPSGGVFSPAAASDLVPRYDIIMFDVDSKDSSVGMSCPPKPFVDKDFIADMKHRCLTPKGTFVLNLVCRDTQLRSEVIHEMLRDSFKSITSYKIPEEVNEILYCCSTLERDGKQSKGKSKSDMKHQNPMAHSFRLVNAHIGKIRSLKQQEGVNRESLSTEDDFLDLDNIMKSLRLL